MNIHDIKAAQQSRMAEQSWDYLNQNSPIYAELIVTKDKMERTLKRNLSVQEVSELL